jgi:signal peptidase I
MISSSRTDGRAPELPGAAGPQTGQLRAEVLDVVRTVVIALALAVLMRTVFYQPFTIPSASMEPGLVEGDYIAVSKFSYGWSRASLPLSPPVFSGRIFGRDPRRGDVVVFRSAADGRTAVIKRVIGLPGDKVQVRGGAVFVNGEAIPRRALGTSETGRVPAALVQESKPSGRPYLTLDQGPGRQGDDTAVFETPVGSYFVMGDNRDNSLDSRWPVGFGMGFIPAENVVGRAEMILLSWEPGASVVKPWTWVRLQRGRLLKRVS